MRPLAIALVLLLTLAATTEAADFDLTHIKRLPVQNDGRKKPFDTYAREAVRVIFDAPRSGNDDPAATVLSILADTKPWLDKVFLVVESPEISKRFFHDKTRISPQEVIAHAKELEKVWMEADRFRSIIKSARGEVPDAMRREADETIALSEGIEPLLMRVQRLIGLERGLRIVPSAEPHGIWMTVQESVKRQEAANLRTVWKEMLDAFGEGNRARFAESSKKLLAMQRAVRPAAMPSRTEIDLEVFYNASRPYTVALALFVLIGGLFLVRLFVRKPWTGILATSGLVLGILWNTFIIVLFTMFADRLPLKNVHEVFLVVIWFLPVIGLFLQGVLRSQIYGGLGAALTVVGYIGLHFLMASKPGGLVIQPLMAILDSGWREIHILSIMLSYAILLVAAGIHVAYLAVRVQEGTDQPLGETSQGLDEQAYHVLAWGFLFLTVGIATGAAWAHSSWGRYWGWDPKEVWATVAWGIYALFLHLRIFRRMRGGWLTAINFLGFFAILFTYFGVTYLLSGLHSYGSS